MSTIKGMELGSTVGSAAEIEAAFQKLCEAGIAYKGEDGRYRLRENAKVVENDDGSFDVGAGDLS